MVTILAGGNENTRTSYNNPLPVTDVNYIPLTITNAINQISFDLNSAPFSQTTNISNDYIIDTVLLKFSTNQSKTITITASDGTILWGGSIDTSSANLGYNTTAQNFNLYFGQAINGGENFTIAVTQTGGACSMDCIATIKQGSQSLLGNPVLASGNNVIGAFITYPEAISKGLITGSNDVHTLGRNNVVNNVRVDVWTGPTGTYVFPPAGGIQMRLISTSLDDTLAGTGAQKIHIHYLDSSYNEYEETINMNGTSAVNTVATNILRINAMHIIQSGTGGTSAGNISLQNTAGTITYAYIEISYNESRHAIYTVPAGKSFYICHWQASSGTTTGSHFTRVALRSTSHDGTLYNTFIAIDEVGTLNNGVEVQFPSPIKIPATADVKITTISDASNANAIVMGAFHGWIE